MISQPVSQKVLGKSVSIWYGKREDKYLRNFTLIECYNMFKKQNPDFHYKFSMFSSVVPNNVKQATEKEVIQNVCVQHSNVRKIIAGLNNLLVRLHRKYLMTPLSTKKTY